MSSKEWSNTGEMNEARVYHTASVLSNGKVLIVGARETAISNTSELFDS